MTQTLLSKRKRNLLRPSRFEWDTSQAFKENQITWKMNSILAKKLYQWMHHIHEQGWNNIDKGHVTQSSVEAHLSITEKKISQDKKYNDEKL